MFGCRSGYLNNPGYYIIRNYVEAADLKQDLSRLFTPMDHLTTTIAGHNVRRLIEESDKVNKGYKYVSTCMYINK